MNAKKIIRVLTASMFAVCIIFTLSSCAMLDSILAKIPGFSQEPAECTHTMEETAAKQATCLEEGNTKYFTCTACTKIFEDKDGQKEITLADTVIAAKGHRETTVKAVAPTCTATGLTEGKKCANCSIVLVAQQPVDMIDHDLQNMRGVAPTCVEEGYTDYKKCSNCDYIEGKVTLETVEHTIVVDEALAPTCVAPGLTEGQMCSVCFEVILEQEIVAALGHTETTDAAVAPTCTETGLTEGKHCSVCNEVFIAQEIVDALGHDMDDGVYLVVPNCTEAGVIKYTCERNCGHTANEDVPPAHPLVEVIAAKAATCYEDGYTARMECSLCDYVVESVAILGGHDGAWAPVDATYEQLVCSVCDRIVKRERNNVIESVDFPNAASGTRIDFTDILHAISAEDNGGKYLVFEADILIDKSAAIGTTEYLFGIKVMDAGVTAGLGGNMVANFQFTMKNNVLSLSSGTAVNDLPVTTPMGETYITFRVVSQLASAAGADGKYVSTHYLFAKETGTDGPMTHVRTIITTSGYAGTVARYDNYKIVLNKEAKADYVLDVKDASFIRTNDTNYLYSACDHVMSDWTIDTEAVKCKTNGQATRICTVDGCGYTETEIISAHKLTAVDGQAPTCTEAGFDLSWVCSDCNVVFGKVEIPATGHDMSDWVEIEDGAKLKKTCQNGCGYYELRAVTENTLITFDDGTVTAGGKVNYSGVTLADDKTTAVDEWEYAKWSVVNKDGIDALCVAIDISKGASGKGRQFTFDTTDGSTEGNVYTFDFDFYIEPGTNATNNSSRIVTEVYFGGATYGLGTYGSIVRRYATSLNFGTTKSWISFRFQYTVIENGKATVEVFVKDAAGNYKLVDTYAQAASGIKLDGVSAIGFNTYSGPGSFTYYINNVSLTRHTSGYEVE